MKKTITLLLVLALSLGLLTACGSTEIRSYQEDAESEDIFANALTAYDADTLVATADGTPVYWNEFAYWLAYIGSQIAYPDENGSIDWYAAEGSEEPLADTLLTNVHDSILQYHILEGMAAEKGIEFGEEGEEYVEGMIQDAITSIAGEEGTEEDLKDYLTDYYLDMDVLRYQGKIQYLYTKLFEELFGANGEKVSDEDIAEYYNTHKSDFTLDRTLVKGRIVAFSDSYRQAKRLKEQMQKAATSATDDKTFADTCEKNGFQYIDNRSGWINFADFLSNLPTTRTQDYEPLLDKMGIQEMEANGTRYYFDFSSVCRRGDVAPLEVVADNIRRILVTQRRSAIIRSHEESIVDQAEQQGHARIYKPVAQPQQEE